VVWFDGDQNLCRNSARGWLLRQPASTHENAKRCDCSNGYKARLAHEGSFQKASRSFDMAKQHCYKDPLTP
jgi:hypothetical protein